MGKSNGFLESLFDDLAEELVYHAVAEMARDRNGKVAPLRLQE